MSEFLKDRQAVPLYSQAAPRPAAPTETPEVEKTPMELVEDRQEALGAAYTLVNTVRGMGGAITEAGFETDHNYRLDLNTELKDVPEQYQPFMMDILTEARSAEHAAWLRDRTMTELVAMEKVGEYTGGSIAGSLGLMMFASLGDPVNLATLGAGVSLSAAKTAAKYGRIKQMAKVAGFEASLNAAIEAPLVAGNPTSSSEDILWAAFFGGAIGAGIGGLAYRVPKGTLAAKEADELAGISEQTLDAMAKAEAHTIVGRENELDIAPPEDLYEMAPEVRRTPARNEPELYDPAETLHAKKVKLEEQLAKMDSRQLPEEPVALITPDDVTGMGEELDFIRRVRSGEAKMSSAAEKANAELEFGKAKRAFLTRFREADPAAYKQVYGTTSNPTTEVFEAGFGAAEKAVANAHKKHLKELEKYKERIDTFGTEKDALLEQMDALEVELSAAKASAKVATKADTAKHAGAAQVDELQPIELSKLSEEEYDEMYNIPEMRQQRIPGTRQLKEKFGKKDGTEKKGTATRWDIAGVLDRSVNQRVRAFARKLFQDAVPKVGHEVNPESASELAEWVRDSAMGTYDAVAKPAYKAWLKEEGYVNNIIARALDWDGKMRSAFEEEVAQAVKTGEHHSKHVLEAADAMALAYKRAFDFAVDSKLPGFEELVYDPHYLPRRTSHQKVMRLNAEYQVASEGHTAKSALGEMYYRAIMEANPTFDPALTARVANNIAKRELQRATKVNYDLPDFGMMTREKLNELFDAIDVTDVDRANFFSQLDQKFAQEDAGRVNHAKRRMNLKTDHTPIMAKYVGPDIPGGTKHGQMVPLRLEDMFETRGDILLQGYVNDLAGWGALNRVTDGQIHNPSSLKKVMEDIVKFDVDMVQDSNRFMKRGARRMSAIEHELDYLMVGVNHTLGRSLTQTDTHSAAARRVLNGWNFMRVMNQTIFPQLSESSKIITSTSIQTVHHYVPAMKEVMRKLKHGEALDDGQKKLVLAAREIGLGTNTVRGGVVTRYESDIDGSLFTKQDKWATRMAHLKKVTARPLQAGMDVQEVLAMVSLQAEMAMRAKGLKSITKGDMDRLAWMGISKSDLKRINKQIMKHATDEKGQPYSTSDSKWMGNLNLDKWDDYTARDKFGFGLKRRVGEIIQTNNVGNLPRFALSDIGAMLVQFRTFPIAAYNKQLMHHLAYNDVNTYMTFALNSAFSAMMYGAQKAAVSVGRDDAQEYRDTALSAKNLAFAAWERSAWGSLTPAIGDVASMAIQGQVMNPYSTRNTGMGKLASGIPAVDLINKTAKAYSSFFDDSSARTAFKNTLAIMPFYNVLGYQNVGQAIAAQIPE